MAKAKAQFKLGSAVIYTVPQNHLTKTVRSGEETIGSVHHPELTQFAGLVGGTDAKGGTADILIFPPGRDPKWVHDVALGDGAGEALPVEAEV